MQEVIYETPDLPECDQEQRKEEIFDSEGIEKAPLNVSAAYEIFKGKNLNTDDVDFSDFTGTKKLRGYSGGHFVVELAGRNGGEPETPLQQYNRLQSEMKELMEKVQDLRKKAESSSAAEKSATDLTVDDVAKLQQQLKQLQIEQIIGQQASVQLADPHSALAKQVADALERAKSAKPSKDAGKAAKDGAAMCVTYELYAQPEPAQNSQQAKVVELDARLARLEIALGTDSTKLAALMSETQAKSLSEIVEVLGQRVQLLDASQVELLEARLTLLSQKLIQISEKKPVLEAEQSKKVSELYEIFKKWDSYCAALPQLVSRMQALKDLHEQALQFSQSLTQLDGVQQEISKTLEVDATLLTEVKTSFQQNLDVIKANCESIDKRMKALGK